MSAWLNRFMTNKYMLFSVSPSLVDDAWSDTSTDKYLQQKSQNFMTRTIMCDIQVLEYICKLKIPVFWPFLRKRKWGFFILCYLPWILKVHPNPLLLFSSFQHHLITALLFKCEQSCTSFTTRNLFCSGPFSHSINPLSFSLKLPFLEIYSITNCMTSVLVLVA